MRPTLHSAVILFWQNTRIVRGLICKAKFNILYFVVLGDLKVFDDQRRNDRKDTADNDEQVDLYFS